MSGYFMFLAEPPARVSPGERFTIGRYGTVNHIARTVSPTRKEPGQLLVAWCGQSGRIPDLYQTDQSARTNRISRAKRTCKNCNRRTP